MILMAGGYGQPVIWDGSFWNRTSPFVDVLFAFGFVFDPVQSVAILAGGYVKTLNDDDSTLSGAAYAIDAGAEDEQLLIALPSPRQFSAMAYDSARKRSVLVGGDNGAAGTGESVLEFDSAHQELGWQSGVPLPSGMGRAGAAMVFDEKRGVMVMMGGAGAGAPNGNDGGRYSDTWELRPAPLATTVSAPQGPVCAGEEFSILVRPTDRRPIQFQWYLKDVVPVLAKIPDATNATLKFTPGKRGNYGFTLKMEDDCGNQFSKDVDVTVHDRPEITVGFTSSPHYQCPGSSILFETFPSSDSPMTLQWYRNDLPLAGQTNAALSLTNLQKSDSGIYYISASNHCGISDTRYLVNDNGQPYFSLQIGPAIKSQPQSVSADPCDSADFTVRAVGKGALHYQWRMDGVPLTEGGYFSGTVSSNLHVAPLVYDIERSFDVVVTDDCGAEAAVISDPAVLTLPTPPWVEVAMNPAPPHQQFTHFNGWTGAYDENRGVLVMYGGANYHNVPSNSLWEYDGNVWTAVQDAYTNNVTSNGQPLFADNHLPVNYAMVYNPDDKLVYLIGDYRADSALTLSTWDGKHWAQPYNGPVMGGLGGYHAVYDRQNHKILIIRSKAPNTYKSELLVYDPLSKSVIRQDPMQPPLEPGVFKVFWVYDEYRKMSFWYQNDFVEFNPRTMWALDQSLAWQKLPGTPGLPPDAYAAVAYNPVRRRTTEFGVATSFPFETATRAFPGDSYPVLPSASDWVFELPDGPPRNAAGSGLSPNNQFFPETLVFDRRRRAWVAPGLIGGNPSGGPPYPVWTTYESRYVDAVTFDPAQVQSSAEIGGTATLKANAFGYGLLHYEWLHNGKTVTNGLAGAGANGGTVSGATTATLSIAAVSQSDFGSYAVVVSNKCGRMTSPPVIVGPRGLSPVISAAVSANNQLSIQFAAQPGASITLESASNIQGPWTKVANIDVPANGEVTYNPALAADKEKFYRTVFPAY
jgi:hypothetical protein